MRPPRGMETSPGHAHWSFKKNPEGAHVTRGMLVEVPCHVDEFGSPRRKLPTEEKKKPQRNMGKENQAITFSVKIERGITWQILNKTMHFKEGFVHLSTSRKCQEGFNLSLYPEFRDH